jgi:oligopeptidase B
MLDPTLPLTVIEWEEWGDPLHDRRGVRLDEGVQPLRERAQRGRRHLPRMLATAGLNDPRVGFHEPGQVGGPPLRDRWPGPRTQEALVLAFVLTELGAPHAVARLGSAPEVDAS